MSLSRRELARVAGGAVVAAGYASASRLRLAGAQTPEAGPGEGGINDPLLSMLQFIPLMLVEENYSKGSELATFGDFELRLASVGVEVPETASSSEDFRELFRATLPVPASSMVQAAVRAVDPLSLFGWTVAHVDRSLYSLTSEGFLHVMQGSFDPAAVEAAWAGNGYQMLEVEGHPVASLSAESDLDPSTELGRLALANANNAALLADGTLLYSPSLAALTSMLQAKAGAVPSLGTYDLVLSVVGAVSNPISGASLLPGPAFLSSMLPQIMLGTPIADLSLPEPGPLPLMGLVGFVSGPAVPDSDLPDDDAEPVPSGSTMVSSLLYASADEAAIAARRSLMALETGSSVANMTPFAEMFAGWRVNHHDGNDVVTVEIDLYGNESIWLQMIYTRDAGFLYS